MFFWFRKCPGSFEWGEGDVREQGIHPRQNEGERIKEKDGSQETGHRTQT